MAKRLSVAERYIRDVLAGKIVVSKLVRLQIELHQRDLREGAARGLCFDRKAAQHVIDFFPKFLVHPEGLLDGQPYVLEPFQQARLWILYGWKWADTGNRRFKYAYYETGRGNAKSMEASGLALYEFFAFGHAGAQVYSVATDKDTARLVYDTSELMVRRSPFLAERAVLHKDNMHIPGTAAKYEPLAADHTNLLGLRPYFINFDELHMQPNANLWNALVSAMGKAANPLLQALTNSGTDRNSLCYRQHEYSVKVLLGIFTDDTWFAWIAALDDGDDPFDERNWPKANQGLGTMMTWKELREAATRAKNDPSALNTFLRYRMSVWTESHVVWMPMDLWDQCAHVVDPAELAGRACVGALDLSTISDISAFVLVFPPAGNDTRWTILPRFFLPKESIQKRVETDRVPYDEWERAQLFILTAGRTIDYDEIRDEIHRLKAKYDFSEIVFDRWNSSDIVKHLEADGFEMVKWGQGYQDMNAPTKRLMEFVLNDQLAHGGNPVLRWMASNTVVFTDPAGFIKPDKSRSKEKIDGIVAAIMGIGRGMAVPEQKYTPSHAAIA